MTIREAEIEDQDAIWAMLEPVLRAGDTYALPADWSKQEALAFWLSDQKVTYVLEDSGQVIGTYYIKANQQGGGAHVCNCGYVTHTHAQGKGVASRMCEHSLLAAKKLGYRAMQYNCVVSTNTRAVALWRRFGFAIVGTLPKAFHHPIDGDVDAFVMYRAL